jgi:membrane-associated protease RseP (regulator of RpoE activity)
MQAQVIHTQSSAFARFMASGYGRMARAALGAALIGAGSFAVGKPAGYAVAGFGLVPIIAGVFNLCPVAPLWGGHFFGSQYCAAKRK